MTALLARSAADVTADPDFYEFLRVLERVTYVPREVTRTKFAEQDGTVAAALADAQVQDPAAAIAQVRPVRVRDLEAQAKILERDLAGVRSARAAWDDFIDNNEEEER